VQILLVEDHAAVAANIAEGMSARGHRVEVASDGIRGLELAIEGRFDVLVLDRMLPRLDGLEVCRRLRAQVGLRLPVLFLTACDELEDKLAGFDAGGDDYLVKPFSLAELAVRLEALLRRSAAVKSGPERPDLSYGELRYAPREFSAWRGARRLHLSRIGQRIFEELLRVAPLVVTQERLYELLWDGRPPAGSTLRTHVYALRRELESAGEAPLLETLHGIGYRLISSTSAR
jgi:DNA-binding response OmpR family regulator